MDPQNNKFANVNMKYSDKAKKVFYNIKLGKSPDREEKTEKKTLVLCYLYYCCFSNDFLFYQ